MMEIVINQQDHQRINISNDNIQFIDVSQNENQNINIENSLSQDIKLKQKENQLVLISGGSNIIGISDVLVNGISVVDGNIAYVIVPTKTSELENNSGYITNETDPTVPYYIKTITLADINNWNNKQDELISGTTIKTINNESLLGSGNLSIEGTVYSAGTGININASNEISNTIVSYNDLEDLPTIPTKVSDLQNDEDFVSENDLSLVAFSGSYADLSDTPNIPQFTSELTNDSGFIDKNVNDLTYYTKTADLGAVALSNNYTDLTNKPTIPTVNDGTLTIQQNGANIETFTANSSTNKTANITVPTKTSELTNDSGYINNNYEIYSGTETRIGTWIDNKPIYRKVFTTTGDNSNYQTIFTLADVDNIINISGWIVSGSDRRSIFSNFFVNNDWTSQVYFTTLWGGLGNLECGNDITNFKNGATIYTTVEYTKTTD